MPKILQNSTINAVAPRARHTANRPRAPLPAQQKKQKAEEREARQDAIDKVFAEWLAYTQAKANECAERFGKKPRYFLDLFFQGGAHMVHQHANTNPHNAFLSLKARELRDEGEVRSLLDIQRDFEEEYNALGQEEREEIIREHKENIAASVTAPRISPRASVQDFLNTMNNVEKLINGLKLRVGVEGFFCVVRNTTSYYTIPKWFFTSKALENYMTLASKNWSLHNVGTKVEAFAIAGCDPMNMCNTSKKKSDYLKAAIREKIQALLTEITGNPNAVMQYTRYEQDIVQRYGISLEGWTYEKLVNPSELSTSLPPLRALHDALTSGTCKFVKLTAAQKKEHEAEHQAKLASGEIAAPIRKKRKDAGMRRKSHKRTKTSKADSGKRVRRDDEDGDESSDDGNGSDATGSAFKSCSVVASDAE